MTWDIRDKTVLLTGATNGIGLEAACVLAEKGAHVVLVGRDRERTDDAVAKVKARAPSATADSLRCDFSSQSSIRALAAEFLANYPRLDVLINNAGTVYERRTLTEDGIEATFAVNHLGYFLLTNLLLDRLKASAPARVVTVASVGHRRGKLDFDDMGFEKGGYFILSAYTRSKLCNVLFARELARRLAGTGVTSNVLHPGNVATKIWSGAPSWGKPLLALFVRPFLISIPEGAAPIVKLASDPALKNVTGLYSDRMRFADPSPRARDDAAAKRLWELSEALTSAAR